MRLGYSPKFKKQYKKLPKKFQQQFDERLMLFIEDPTNPRLRIHMFQGKYAGYLSINISGDIRALYKIQDKNTVIFALIGTHSELYG